MNDPILKIMSGKLISDKTLVLSNKKSQVVFKKCQCYQFFKETNLVDFIKETDFVDS